VRRLLRDLPRPAVAPSLLAADFARLADEVARVRDAGADLLHLDVMDGHFVPNLTLGPVVVEKLRAVTDLLLDVHLMVEEPGRFLQPFAEAGADNLTFHAEVVADPAAMAARIHELGCTAGICVNPDADVALVLPGIPHVEMVLLMSVYAGFGGQQFMPGVLPRLRAVREALEPGQRLEVDGGIYEDTAARVAEAGADTLVAGTAVFRAPGRDYAKAVAALRRAAEAARPA